jgi:hypothetical protein
MQSSVEPITCSIVMAGPANPPEAGMPSPGQPRVFGCAGSKDVPSGYQLRAPLRVEPEGVDGRTTAVPAFGGTRRPGHDDL